MDAHESIGTESGAVPGLASSQAGYRIVPAAMSAEPGPRDALPSSRSSAPGGEPVTDYDDRARAPMHLIVVRRDFAGFQHVHPELCCGRDLDGRARHQPSPAPTGSSPTSRPEGGESMTLATDLSVPGRFEPGPLPMPRADGRAPATATRCDLLARARGRRGDADRVHRQRDGEPVDGVQPYLGADGHLVVLREGDLAFLHAHPQGEPGGTGPIAFDVDYPSAGAYRMFLQFRHRGEVHTAAFTELVGGASRAARHGEQVHNGTGADHAH